MVLFLQNNMIELKEKNVEITIYIRKEKSKCTKSDINLFAIST